MVIREFTFEPSLVRDFVEFGYEHYRGDPQWIPPLKNDLYAQLSPQYPFYRKHGNQHKHFLASAGKHVVGRLSAFVNRDLRDRDETHVGAVGFFECADDYEIARDLLDAATGWLHSEHGLRRMWSPMNFDIWHSYRLMTRGFEQKIFYGEPYNKRYYSRLLEEYGFIAKQHWNSVEVTGAENIEKMIARGEARYEEFISKGYRFEPFDTKNFLSELDKLHCLLTEAFRSFLGFTPISSAEFRHLFASMKYALHSRFFFFAYDESNKLAGFMGAFLDLSDGVRAMRGSRGLTAKARVLYHRRRTNRVMIHIYGTTPQEAAKQSGLGRALLYKVAREILAANYETILITLMAQGNAVRGLLGGRASDDRRQYTLYELSA